MLIFMQPRKASPQAPTNDEVPVTRGMLIGVRTELIERIESVRGEVQKVNTKIDAVHGELRSEIHAVRSEIHDVKAGMARIEVLVEEQNARNKIVLDGITAVLSRQDQVERRVDHVEDTVCNLIAKGPAR